MEKVILFGATGLIGELLLKKLLDQDELTEIVVVNRTSQSYQHPKIKEQVNDLKEPDSLSQFMHGDVLFIALGSTIKKAGSQERFAAIDLHLPVQLAGIAVRNGVGKCVVVSSLGADAKASNFYLQVKGKMEEALIALNFNQLHIFQPSMLLGARKEFRLGELIGKKAMQLFSFLFIGSLKKYKAIQAEVVAEAMVKSLNSGAKLERIESDEIEKRAKA